MAFALVVGACSTVSVAPTKAPGPDQKRPLIDDYARNLAKWQESGISRYGFTYRPFCFCPLGAHVVVVDDGVVRIDGLAIDPSTVPTAVPAGVPGLFDLVRRAIDGDRVTIRYDSVTGVPVTMDSDPVANAVDDELTFEITNWTLEPPDDQLLGRLTASRRTWDQVNIWSYRWSIKVTCQCVHDGRLYDIVVHDGEPFVSSGGRKISAGTLEGVPTTIPQFFEMGTVWLIKPGSSATFDAEHGYPTLMSVGPDPVVPGQAETIEVVSFDRP